MFSRNSHIITKLPRLSLRGQDGEDRLHHQELPAAAAAALPDPGQGGQRGGRGQGQLRHGEGQQQGQNCQRTFAKSKEKALRIFANHTVSWL